MMSKTNKSKAKQARFQIDGSMEITHYEVTPDSHIIKGKNRLEKHLTGTKTCKAVMYVMGLEFIEQYLEEIGIERLTVIIGKEVSVSRKRNLDPELVKKFAKWRKEGRLEIRVPIKGEMHEKMLFCTNDDEKWFKDINGSANATATGSGGSSQSNRITTVSVTGTYAKSNYYQKCMTQWESYLKKSQPFMDSLFELLPQDEEEWIPTIVKYLESDGDVDLENTVEVRMIQQKVGTGLLESSIEGRTEYTFSLEGYSEPSIEKAVDILNKRGFGVERIGLNLNAPVSGLDLDVVQKQSAPMMSLIDDKLWIRIDGRNICRTVDDIESKALFKALTDIEMYVESVENAHGGDIHAKMAVTEFLLSVMCAPFEHLYMRHRRKIYQRKKEGPRMTSYFGNAGNGKSYACLYALKLLSGVDMDPLTSEDFTKKAILNAAASGTCFPLLFDDLQKERITQWGKWGKAYWDSGYTINSPYPQLIITANDRIDSSGPLGRRVREIAMRANFSSNESNSLKVEQLVQKNTDLFMYFSKLMIEMWNQTEPIYSHSDELKAGRVVIEKLYKIAKKKQPKWWPKQEIEKIHDDQALEWLEMINKKICIIKYERDEIIAAFDPNSPSYEVARKRKLLPAHVAPEPAGTKVRIRNPIQFIEWLSGARAVISNPLRRHTKKMFKHKFRG